jgi:hypothetical protein
METQKTELERWMELSERFDALVEQLQPIDFDTEEIF